MKGVVSVLSTRKTTLFPESLSNTKRNFFSSFSLHLGLIVLLCFIKQIKTAPFNIALQQGVAPECYPRGPHLSIRNCTVKSKLHTFHLSGVLIFIPALYTLKAASSISIQNPKTSNILWLIWCSGKWTKTTDALNLL